MSVQILGFLIANKINSIVLIKKEKLCALENFVELNRFNIYGLTA